MERLGLAWRRYQEPPGDDRIDVLDGFRALFVLLVGWYHIWQQSWLSPSFTIGSSKISLDFLLRSGYIWVDGLILLSGFLLYLPYATGGKRLPAIGSFYRRRLARILPSYLLCVLPLFVLAVLQGKYASALAAIKDLAAHLTFTHPFFSFSSQQTPLNGALWTLGVEIQFYLLFPFLARAFRRHPAITWTLMAGTAFAFRAYVKTLPDTAMYLNQLPAFLDVYANGFLAASIYTALRKKLTGQKDEKKIKLLFTAGFVLCVCQLVQLAKGQAAENGIDQIRLGQMERRFALSAVLGMAMICAACSLPGLRFLLGNPLMRFLSAVSFQFYIYHQMLAVRLKDWGFPPSAVENPWMNGDYSWQFKYTLCCFLLALIVATLVTYLFERPIARRLRR